jgi:hypothetical protein
MIVVLCNHKEDSEYGPKQCTLADGHPEPHRMVFVYDLSGPVHTWFELSYAHYLTIPRSVLQSMPVYWQERFVKCLQELDEALPWRPSEGRYYVQLRNDKGYFARDPLSDYRHVGRYTADRLKELGRGQ